MMVVIGMALATSAQEVPTPQLHSELVASVFGPNNYPPSAMRAGEQGRVVVDLAIDAMGRVTNCTVVEAASSNLALQTCRLATATPGLFSPAKDVRGRAVPGHYSLKIRWQLPDDSVVPTTLRVVAEPDGRVRECEVGKPSESQPISRGGAQCGMFAQSLVGAIARHTGKAPTRPFEGRFLIDYAADAASHNVLAWPKDIVILDDMNVAYGLTAQGRPVDCRRTIRVWDSGSPVPSPCDGSTETDPSAPPAVAVSKVDALFRFGYRLLPEGQ